MAPRSGCRPGNWRCCRGAPALRDGDRRRGEPERPHPSGRAAQCLTGWGRRVLIAGGAGTIGNALTTGFLDVGARVAVIDRSDEVIESLDPRVVVRDAADLSGPAAAHASVDAARGRLGGIDGFVYCVGINDRQPIEDYSAQDWDHIVSVNLTSAFHTATEAAVGMRGAGHGRIVFFSSVAGHRRRSHDRVRVQRGT
jgi:gluconate 5-dehydrogenase